MDTHRARARRLPVGKLLTVVAVYMLFRLSLDTLAWTVVTLSVLVFVGAALRRRQVRAELERRDALKLANKIQKSKRKRENPK